MEDPERRLRELWTRQGVDPATQDQILADLTTKAQPVAWVGPFQIPYESLTVGTERKTS